MNSEEKKRVTKRIQNLARVVICAVLAIVLISILICSFLDAVERKEYEEATDITNNTASIHIAPWKVC